MKRREFIKLPFVAFVVTLLGKSENTPVSLEYEEWAEVIDWTTTAFMLTPNDAREILEAAGNLAAVGISIEDIVVGLNAIGDPRTRFIMNEQIRDKILTGLL